MTPNRAHVLRAIKALTTPDGVTPSYRQLSDELGVSISATHRSVVLLERDGKIGRVAGSRGIRILETDSRDPGQLADTIIQRMSDARKAATAASEKFTTAELRRIIVGVLAQ